MTDYRAPVEKEGDWFAARVRRHVSELVRLALPIIVSRAGLLVLVTVDTLMVGRFDTTELAYLSIGTALSTPVLLTSMGFILGTIVLSANYFGAGEFAACGAVWRRSIPYAAWIGLAALVFCMFGPLWLDLSDQSPDLAENGGAIMRALGWGMPAHLVFLASAFFLDGIRRPIPAMVLMLAANVLNFALNWVFIGGHFGFPEGGAMGAAWATTVSRWFLAIAATAYIWWMKDQDRFQVRSRPQGGWRSWAMQRNLGYASAVSIGVETISFGVLNLFAGWLGETALGAFTVALNILALVFMAAIGLGSATAVRVGIAYGRGDMKDLALAGWTGLSVNSLIMGMAAVVFFLMPARLAGFYTADSTLLAAVVPLIVICAYVIVLDGGQAVMANALRGRRDVWVPSLFQTLSYFGVMIPVSWYLAFQLGKGASGLFLGIFIASVVSLSLLCLRFHFVSRRSEPRPA